MSKTAHRQQLCPALTRLCNLRWAAYGLLTACEAMEVIERKLRTGTQQSSEHIVQARVSVHFYYYQLRQVWLPVSSPAGTNDL